jgi:isopenicillin N synthase-like dioxygenase
VEFADLAIIDLSKAHTPEGRQELYPQLRDALRTQGFVYAINHGYTQAQVRLTLVTHAEVPEALL